MLLEIATQRRIVRLLLELLEQLENGLLHRECRSELVEEQLPRALDGLAWYRHLDSLPAIAGHPGATRLRGLQTGGLRKERQLTAYPSPVSACPSCGHENDPGAKFCSECGTALREARPSPRTERKVVTVLFADLVGFTARAERLDPEDVQAVLEPYHARLRSELERFGGTVEKFIGDAVMALFGAPIAHEDDPERAVRAALAIRDWIADEGKLEVRIGVNTGEALINLAARPEFGEGMAAGDVVNTTARIEAAAPANGILVGESTHRATANAIDYAEPTTIDAKGKDEPIAVWEARQARSRLGVDVVPEAATRLVGRTRELDALKAALARARQQRSPELVTLVGVPGIGKSRLVTELLASIEQEPDLVYWRQGRSLPYGEGVSYWALAEMVRRRGGRGQALLGARGSGRRGRGVGTNASPSLDRPGIAGRGRERSARRSLRSMAPVL
ncbi:MAG: zinc-ribbon domain-containing protein [Actinobacteria bacterium]|nr:MAG: zinc-ribbon domain-containing protein [Actinomycetota bacterium]